MKTPAITAFLMYIFAFGLGTALKAQPAIPKDSVSGNYSYQDVIKVDSVSKEQLYKRAKAWVLKSLKSSDNILELDDKEFNAITSGGTIPLTRIGTSGFMSYVYDDAKLTFKATIQFKDGKVRYTFDNFSYSANKMFNGAYNGALSSTLENLELTGKTKEQALTDIASKMTALIKSFTADITAKSNKSQDDW